MSDWQMSHYAPLYGLGMLLASAAIVIAGVTWAAFALWGV